MLLFNVKEMANGILMPSGLSRVERETIIKDWIETALNIFNNPSLCDGILDDLLEHYEFNVGILNTDRIVLDLVKVIKHTTRKLGWDSRLKAKVEFKQVGSGYHKARIVMDLDETLQALSSNVTEPVRLNDVISDHPEVEMLNEIISLRSSKTPRRVPVLPDRRPVVVKGNQESGWIPGYREDYRKIGY